MKISMGRLRSFQGVLCSFTPIFGGLDVITTLVGFPRPLPPTTPRPKLWTCRKYSRRNQVK